MEQEIPFQKIQPYIYDVYIYLAFKYRNVKVYLYLEGSGASKVIVGCRCFVSGQSLKDLGKLSIIVFLCFLRASSRNTLIGSPAPSSLFYSAMGGLRGLRG